MRMIQGLRKLSPAKIRLPYLARYAIMKPHRGGVSDSLFPPQLNVPPTNVFVSIAPVSDCIYPENSL